MSAPVQPPPPVDAPPPSLLSKTFQAFTYRNFRLMWTGAFTSTTGSFVQEVAQSWLVYQLTNDPFLLGAVSFLNNAPILLFSLIGGVAADRMDRRMLLIGSQLTQMSAALALATLIWTDQIQIWHILAAAFVTGMGQAFGGPAYQALIPSLVDKKDLPNAIALMSIQFNMGQVVGPAIGGAAFAGLGAGWCFCINGLSFLAVIGTLLILPSTFVPAKHQTHVLESLKEGLRFVFHNKAMFSLVALAVSTAFLGVPVRILLPAFAEDIYHVGPEGYSQLLSSFGLGGVLGALAVATYGNKPRKGLRALMMQLALGAITLGFGLMTKFWGGALLLFATGASVLFVFSSITSLVQLLAPENMRGRIMSVYNTAFRGSMALGPPVAGYLARSLGAPAIVAVNGALLVLVALVFLTKNKEVRAL
ncbi:MAG: MFS transporter [Acidobacteria bacterium]|nr:MFS transporter [Acidobacteriota bacterium]